MQTEKRKKVEKSDTIAAKKTKWSKKKTENEKSETKPFKKEFKKKSEGDREFKKKSVGDKEEKEALKRKDIKRNRKMKDNPNYEVEMSMKKMWEKLRNSETEKEKHENVQKIFDMIKTSEKSLEDFAFAHDTTRVLQSCLQHGSNEQRRFLYDSLKKKIPVMASEKYARNIVLKFIKYGERDIKDFCIENMGNVRKLVRSAIGQSVLEYAFNQFAQSKQRNEIVSKLYGKSWTRLSKTEKEPTLISVTLKNLDFCETILTDFMEDLKALTEKEVMQQTISHRAFLDFFNLCLYLLHSEEEKLVEKRKRIEQIRGELIEELKASVIHMIHTPDGARAGLHCIWFGSAKDRKLILKTLKEFLVKVITADSGHMLALGAIDAVDDTVLVKKQLISPICKELDSLMENKNARKVIWYILNARDRKTLLPDVIKLLEVGDQSVTCKKPREVKYDELKQAGLPSILEWFSENVEKCISDAGLLPMLVAASNHDRTEHISKGGENMLLTLQSALAKKLNMDYGDEGHPLKKPGVQMSIRKMIEFDQERDDFKFSRTLSTVCGDSLQSWLTDNRGCFLILNMLEVNDLETAKNIENAIGEFMKENGATIGQTSGGKLLVTKAFDPEGNFRTHYERKEKKEAKNESIKKDMKMETG